MCTGSPTAPAAKTETPTERIALAAGALTSRQPLSPFHKAGCKIRRVNACLVIITTCRALTLCATRCYFVFRTTLFPVARHISNYEKLQLRLRQAGLLLA